MDGNLDNHMVVKAYARWAPVYDLVFGAGFEQGRRAAIAAAERIGGRILEVGVGTGISLADYARTNRLVGVDIFQPMPGEARAGGEGARPPHPPRRPGNSRADAAQGARALGGRAPAPRGRPRRDGRHAAGAAGRK